jgi:FMN reductase
MKVGVVVGNPKPKSRTLDAAVFVAEKVTGVAPTVVVDAVDYGGKLIGWGDPEVAKAIADIRSCDVVIFASPTYKATYTGLLKLVLDQVPQDGLAGVTAIPVMLGAGMHHAMAPDLLLKPVLVELGATCPTRGLYLLDSDYVSDSALDPWLSAARVQANAAVGSKTVNA